MKQPEMTWNDLQQARNDLKPPTANKKRSQETTYSEQETTWNDPQPVRHNLGHNNNLNLPTARKRRLEATKNKQILGLFYNMV